MLEREFFEMKTMLAALLLLIAGCEEGVAKNI
jgi:hypothetical protein